MIDPEKKTPLEKLGTWYETLDPSRRKKLTLMCGGALLFVVATIMVTATSNDGAINFIQKPRKVEYTLFNGKKPRDVSIDAMGGRLNKLTEQVNEIRIAFQRQDERIHNATEQIKIQADELNKKTAKLNEQTTELFGKVQDAQDSLKTQVPLPELNEGGALGSKRKLGGGGKEGFQSGMPYLLGQQPATTTSNNQTGSAETGPKIRVVTGSGGDNKNGANSNAGNKTSRGKIAEYVNVKSSSGKSGMPDMFLPAGSIVSGTLITGLDAPTSNQSRQDPFPALMRVKHEAILPNRFRMDIRECFLIASGYGDMSSERAYMRAERISCVKKDGSIIETTMDAYSVGEDGKAGIRGRLVSKNGQIIGNALLSGFVSGITNAFAPQRVQSLQTSVLPGQAQAYQYPSAEMIGGQALAGGIKGAATQIAQYYLDMAKNIFPIIEVDAGRKVDFIMIRGLSLQPKAKSSTGNTMAIADRNTYINSGTRHMGTSGMPDYRQRGTGGGYGGSYGNYDRGYGADYDGGGYDGFGP